jgi:hypothetical protein
MMKMMMKRLSTAGLRAFAARFKRQEEAHMATFQGRQIAVHHASLGKQGILFALAGRASDASCSTFPRSTPMIYLRPSSLTNDTCILARSAHRSTL